MYVISINDFIHCLLKESRKTTAIKSFELLSKINVHNEYILKMKSRKTSVEIIKKEKS